MPYINLEYCNAFSLRPRKLPLFCWKFRRFLGPEKDTKNPILMMASCATLEFHCVWRILKCAISYTSKSTMDIFCGEFRFLQDLALGFVTSHCMRLRGFRSIVTEMSSSTALMGPSVAFATEWNFLLDPMYSTFAQSHLRLRRTWGFEKAKSSKSVANATEVPKIRNSSLKK